MLTSKSKILIADDHALMRMALRELVAGLIPDDHILETDSASTVMDIVHSEPDLDLLLLDLLMPGGNIFNVIEQLTNSFKPINIVVISASEKKSHIQKAIDLGVKGYILKSSNMEIIKQALELVLAGGRYIPSEIYQQADEESTNLVASLIDKTLSLKSASNRLTDRQLEIFKLLGEGKSNKEIASQMYISVNTVKIHVSAILKSLGLDNRSQAGIISRQLFEDSI